MDEKFWSLWPLIFFTVLLPAAVGLAAGSGLVCLFTEIGPKGVLTALWWALGLSVLSGICVSFHLGHVERSMSAVRGIKHSNLSHEILLAYGFGFLLAAGIICIYMSGPEMLVGVVLGLGGILGLATAFSIGRVYKLAGQITWRGIIPALGPITGSMLTAAAIFYVLADAFNAPMVFGGVFWFFLGLDGIFTAKRFRDFLQLEHSQYIMVYPRQKVVVKFCYGVKLLLMAGIVVLFITGYFKTVLIVVGMGMLLDRAAFYASAARKTPKVNIAVAKDERMRAALDS